MIELITKEELTDKTSSASYERAVELRKEEILKDINSFFLLLLQKRPQVLDAFDGAVVLKKHRLKNDKIARNIMTVACERVIKELINAGYTAKYSVRSSQLHDEDTLYEDHITVYWNDAADNIYDMI